MFGYGEVKSVTERKITTVLSDKNKNVKSGGIDILERNVTRSKKGLIFSKESV